jgi:hypothetical protein
MHHNQQTSHYPLTMHQADTTVQQPCALGGSGPTHQAASAQQGTKAGMQASCANAVTWTAKRSQYEYGVWSPRWVYKTETCCGISSVHTSGPQPLAVLDKSTPCCEPTACRTSARTAAGPNHPIHEEPTACVQTLLKSMHPQSGGSSPHT